MMGKRVFVAGHRGMVGSAILRVLQQRRCEVLTAPRPGVDLRRQEEVESWMQSQAPDAVFLAAARVGGIRANDTRPAEFIYDNLAIESAVIESARRAGVRKLLFLGSSCIYPRMASQPIAEEALLTGPLEPTNEWYAVAKIAGIKLCQAYRRQYGCNYISLMPTNLYGPGDSFDLEGGHVIPALMRKMHEGRMSGSEEVVVWGSGTPRREFLHVDDLADAAVHLMEVYAGEEHVNVGTGHDITIAELAQMIKEVTGFHGRLTYDRSKPDGTPRKLLDVTRMTELGWRARIKLPAGLADTYRWFLDTGHVSSPCAISSSEDASRILPET
ncbi:MAG: GDP-L-fucose synthase [Gammaproteobacteria bacterium]|nr:GDP-L-fucose synthase [Gammaproteobacteria bacterium]